LFNVGDRIVYPMHGAGIIEEIRDIEVLGEKKKYFVMKMPIGDMKAMVPVDNADEIGVREIIDKIQLEQVIQVLKGDKSIMSQNWNRRFRANMERLKSGDIKEVAAVVRNLMILDNEKGLSTGERKMLSSAKQMLLSEMVLVCDMELEDTEKLVEDAINDSDEKELAE